MFEIWIVETKHKKYTNNDFGPNELWQVELIGQLTGKDGIRKFIFLAIDHFSKWVEVEIIRDKRADTIAGIIKRLIIERHGIPSQIMFDNGLKFENSQCRKMSEQFNFKWDYNSPYHHEAVGCVERANQTFMEKIRKLSEYGKISWEKVVEKAALAMNVSLTEVLAHHHLFLDKKNYQRSQ